MQRVLVIEKNRNLQNALRSMLEEEWFSPILVEDIEHGLRCTATENPELILLDLQSTECIEPEMCSRLSTAGVRTPIIVLSEFPGDRHIVPWLDAGADDYVVKPFSMRELLARIHALLRRQGFGATNVRRFGDLTVDVIRRFVTRRGDELALTRLEFDLLVCFLQNPDRVLTRNYLLNLVWGYAEVPRTRTVDRHVERLRKKLEPDPAKPRHFRTEHGVGYRFVC